MLARLRGAAVGRPRHSRGRGAHETALREGGSDAGFTLIEVLVSLVLIGIALTAFTTFFITMISATNGQSTRQAAVQLADGSMEQVRALKGSAVTAGRDQQSSQAQWAAPLAVATVSRYLAGMTVAWDSTAANGAGATATLPTVPTTVTVNGVTFSRSWSIGNCWRPPGDDNEACLSSSIPGSTAYFRVIGAVSWTDGSCPTSACSYVTSTLVSSAASEPLFTGSHPVPVTVDSVGPAGGSVDASNLTGTGTRYSTSTSLSVALDKGTDNVGLADNGARLYRASATLTSAGGTANGACGVFGQYAQIGTDDPVSPVAEVVADQACYSYLYVVADLFGNWTTYVSGSVKVDTTAPATAPALAFSAVSNTYVSGTTVYYRPGATSGSFTATATATDVASGIASYTFPDLGTGWTATPGAAGVVTYSWTGVNPAVPGAQTVTATNNAFRAAATAGFSVLADSVGPTGGSVDAIGLTGTGTRYSTATTLSIGLAKGTDSSGVAATGATLSRATATLTSAGTPNGTCGVFGGYTLITGGTDPATPIGDSVTDQACYRYQYVVADGVGNQTTYTSGDIKVDTTAPAAPSLGFSALTNVVAVGTAVSYTGLSGSFTVTATATDTGSGILSYAFPTLGAGWTATPGVTGVMTYAWSGTPAVPGAQTVTATNNAFGVSTAAGFTVTTDMTGPTGGSVDAIGLTGTGTRYSTSTTLSIGLDKGTDPSGVAATGATLSRAAATLSSAGTANGGCGVFGGYTL
ncbi:MAG: hypothetical protein QOE03_2196, partial [Micromonosporaceae bacterium]|nr:hypothetical protein [Micromonosporaceae bacterium]